MAETLEQSLIQVGEKEFHQMFEEYNLTIEQVKEAREAVIEHCLKQEHLKDAVPTIVKTYVIERALLVSKGSTELCKQRVEKILSARTLLSEFFLDRNIEEFELLLEVANHITVPKLIPMELSAVTIFQLRSTFDEKLDIVSYFRYMFMMADYRIYQFYCVAERFVIDLKGMPFSIFKILNPIIIKKAELLTTEYYGSRLKGIHILNAPYYIDKIIYLLKGVLKPKIAARIHVHKSYEDMHEFIPKEVLPKDYGGYEDTCSELSDKWRVLLGSEDAQRKISELEKAVPDESKRQNFMYEFNKEYTCMSGTFKKLELD